MRSEVKREKDGTRKHIVYQRANDDVQGVAGSGLQAIDGCRGTRHRQKLIEGIRYRGSRENPVRVDTMFKMYRTSRQALGERRSERYRARQNFMNSRNSSFFRSKMF